MAEDPDVRIGTAERERAQQSLSEHFAAGRLDTAEFEERSGSVGEARTSHELARIFDDLPADPNQVGAGTTAPVRRQPPTEPVRRNDNGLSGWRGALVGSTGGLTLIAFFVLLALGVSQAWLVFIVGGVVAAGIRGYRGDR